MGFLVEQVWHGNPGAFRARDRRGGRFNAYVPHPLRGWHPLLPADVAASVAAAENELRDTAIAARENDTGMFFWAESLGSSRIEGVAPGTKKVVHALARRQRTPDRDFYGPVGEVLANIDATSTALDLLADRERISIATLQKAHRVLMDASPTPHLGGRIRDEQNWVGGNDWHPLEGDFIPPPPEHCDPLLEDLVSYLRVEDHSPLLQAAIAHAQFETIHPFGDGNGRTGRAVLYAVLKHRLCGAQPAALPPISLALSRDRDAYIAALAAYQTYVGSPDSPARAEALGPCAEALATASHRACAAVRRYTEAMVALQDRWRAAAGGRRGRSAVSAAIDCLPAHPSLTPSALSEVTGFSEPRSAAALRHLETAGVVKARTVETGMRVYDADQVFNAYEVMASTICDPQASLADYADIVASSLIAAPARTHRPTDQRQKGDSPWELCPLSVKSTGLPCGLKAGHQGHCRQIPHRKHPPR